MSLDKVPLIQYGKAEDIINSVTHAVGAVFGCSVAFEIRKNCI